jgi:hypothetical protein
MEAGCGTGSTLFPLMELNPLASFYAFDFADTAVACVTVCNRPVNRSINQSINAQLSICACVLTCALTDARAMPCMIRIAFVHLCAI